MTTPILILVLLTAPLVMACLINKGSNRPLDLSKYASWGLGIAFVFFCIGHFVKTDGMVAMLPPWVPFRSALVYATGVLELLIGLALFTVRYRKVATWAAIAVFVLFFPANLYAALNAVGLGGHQWGPVYLWIRAPLQLILIGWAYFLCLGPNRRSQLFE